MMRSHRTTPDDVDRTVAKLNEALKTEHWRNPDRPDAVFVKNRGRRPSEVVRAQGRIRTAAWRNSLDRRNCPTTSQIGMALIMSLVTTRQSELTEADRGIVGRALVDLVARGFDLKEAQAMLRRLRNRLVDPADRAGEPPESTSEALSPSSWGAAPKMPF
jgi:hypothetical protein